jgi:hypothetical protein
MTDISLLPEEMRKKGDIQKKASGTGEDLTFHVPQADIGAGLTAGATLPQEKKRSGFFSWLFPNNSKKVERPDADKESSLADTRPKSPRVSVGGMMQQERAAMSTVQSSTAQAIRTVPPPAAPKMHVPSAETSVRQRPTPVEERSTPPVRFNQTVRQPKPAQPTIPAPAPQGSQTAPSVVRNERSLALGVRAPSSTSAPAPAPAPAVGVPPRVHDVATPNAPGLRVSLIPTMQGEGGGFSGNQGRKAVFLGVGVLVFLLLGTVGTLRYVQAQKTKTETWNNQRNVAQESLATLRQSLDGARLFAAQVQTLRVLLSGHLAWSQFFTLLEKNTHQDIAYTQIATDGVDTVILQADARSYRAIAEQVEHLSLVEGIEEVHVSGMTTELGPTGTLKGVHLLLTIRFDPQLLLAESDRVPGL